MLSFLSHDRLPPHPALPARHPLRESQRRPFQVPGLGIAIIKDGKIVHSKGYGVRSKNNPVHTDENTLFAIASNTKAFTAAAIGMFADEGKLTWDDKVIKYIPEFRLYDPWITGEFTIRDLLTHRSGLPEGAGDLMLFPDSSNFTQKEIIKNLRFLKPAAGFRTRFDYSNIFYVVAGEVLSKAGGESWEKIISGRILQPLGMNQSAATYGLLKNKSNVALPHAIIGDSLREIPRHEGLADQPAGSIYSSIADLSKWVLMLLSEGKFGEGQSKRLLSEQVYREMLTPQTLIPVNTSNDFSANYYNKHFDSYGIGFFISDVNGYKQVSHSGGLPGMYSQITMFPELNLGIIVLTNQEVGAAIASVTNEIKDGYLNMPGADWISVLSDLRIRLMKQHEKITDSVWSAIALRRKSISPKFNPESYAGVYVDNWFGKVVISLDEGKLLFTSERSPKWKGQIFPYENERLVVKWEDRSLIADAFLDFSKGKTGKLTGMKMRPISPLTDFSFDFTDLDFRKLP